MRAFCIATVFGLVLQLGCHALQHEENVAENDLIVVDVTEFTTKENIYNALQPERRQKRDLGGILDGIGDLGDSVGGMVDGLGDSLGGALGGLGGLGDGLGSVVDKFAKPISTILDIGGTIKKLFFTRNEANHAAENYNRQMMGFQLQQLCDQICVTEWTPWTLCTQRCGGGTTSRTREQVLPGQCATLADFSCRHSTEQTGYCNVECPNGGMRNEQGGCTCPPAYAGTCCDNEVTCPYPGRPRHGETQGTFPAKYGMVATFSCDPGFAMDGADLIVCRQDSNWSGQKPACSRVQCTLPAAPENGEIMNSQEVFVYGDEVHFVCNDGFELRGPQTRRCVAYEGPEGKWTGFTPSCRPRSCGDPDIPINGEREGTDFSAGSTVTYTCGTGFRLVGSSRRTCMNNGRWSGRLPECEVIECDPPIVPRNGRLINERASYTFGIRIVYECETGYIMVGSAQAQCVVDEERELIGPGGMWDEDHPYCEATICENPGIPDNGAKEGSLYFYPHNITYACFAGYILRGPQKLHCQRDGTWDNVLPSCEPCLQDFYRELSQDACVPCPPHTHTLTPASTSQQQCSCDVGYQGPPGGPCEEIECPRLEAPENGRISDCGTNLGDECDFTCEDGFIIQRGSSRRVCQEDGEWTGRDVVCGACPKDTFKSDMRSCLPCPRYSHTDATGSSIRDCTCNEGYEGPAGGPCVDVIECTANQGQGPCSDVCINEQGGYRCGCSIPGYAIGDHNRHQCILEDTCRNLTDVDAPDNGGLVCHWYIEQNSQQCATRCNPGYEFPARVNNYETCGPTTGYKWSHEERGEEIEPCIEEFFPDFRMEANSSYFVQACRQLTEGQKMQVRNDFAQTLNEQGVCRKRRTKVCDVNNIGIICGQVTRRRRRDADSGEEFEEEVEEAGIQFDVSAFKFKEHTKDCNEICTLLRIRRNRCRQLCIPTYKRFLKAAVLYSRSKLHQIYRNRNNVRFFSVGRLFDPVDGSLETSDVIVKCERGMREDPDGSCVPCTAGTKYEANTNGCLPCPPHTYQSQPKQTECLPCPVGTINNRTASTHCARCPEGTYGYRCNETCGPCQHGDCDPGTGICICHSGYEGEYCEADIQSCSDDSCFPGTPCIDIPAPGIGYRCGPCPEGLTGDGILCQPAGYIG